jgi:hypothetical protein
VQAVEQCECTCLRLSPGVIDLVDRHQSLRREHVRVAGFKHARLGKERRVATTRQRRRDRRSQQVRLAGARCAPEQQPRLGNFARGHPSQHVQNFGIASGQEIGKRGRLGGGEFEDELFHRDEQPLDRPRMRLPRRSAPRRFR